MKAIIGGKRYNSETARQVGSDHGYEGSRGDFAWFSEGLYLAPRGSWFLCGEGNAASPWAHHYGGREQGPGSGLRPITAEEARDWLERYEETDALEEHFASEVTDA